MKMNKKNPNHVESKYERETATSDSLSVAGLSKSTSTYVSSKASIGSSRDQTSVLFDVEENDDLSQSRSIIPEHIIPQRSATTKGVIYTSIKEGELIIPKRKKRHNNHSGTANRNYVPVKCLTRKLTGFATWGWNQIYEERSDPFTAENDQKIIRSPLSVEQSSKSSALETDGDNEHYIRYAHSAIATTGKTNSKLDHSKDIDVSTNRSNPEVGNPSNRTDVRSFTEFHCYGIKVSTCICLVTKSFTS